MNEILRAPLFVTELLRRIRQIRPDISIPDANGLNQGQTLIKKPSKGTKIVLPVAARTPLGGFTEKGRNIVVGQSTAGKLAQHLKQDLRCKDVEYNITKAPLTEQKVKSLEPETGRERLCHSQPHLQLRACRVH